MSLMKSGGIPGFNSDLSSSDFNIDHAQHMLSLMQIDQSKKTTPPVSTQAEAWEDMDAEDDQLDDTNVELAVDRAGNNDDGVEQLELELDLFDGDMQVDDNNGGAWQHVGPQAGGTSATGVLQSQVSIKYL